MSKGTSAAARIPYRHWIDSLIEEIITYWGSTTDTINCSCGLSVSGLQHVGRLRGEVTITNTIMHLLRKRGIKTRHTIVRYTSDPWKGKPTQIEQFSNKEDAKQYIGHRLIDVPDPKGELSGWVERYWKDFGDYLDEFSQDAEVLSTHDIYTWPEMQELVRYTIEHRELVRDLVNRYRARAPYPPDWIPVEVACEKCLSLSDTTVTAVDLEAYTAEYRCDSCGQTGSTSIARGKLSWRVEWAALWHVLNVGFEPFGKDHATPGGSRDSAKEIAEKFFKFKSPVPYAYEWVGLIEGGVDKGDMGSSDFNGFTPKVWTSVAPGYALRYLFLKNKPMRRITLGLEYVPNYVGQYERAERVYYKVDKPRASPSEIADINRSYELAQLGPVSKSLPLQIPYLHAVVLAQIIPTDNLIDVSIEKLAKSELIPKTISKRDHAYIKSRLMRAKTWVTKYSPETYRIKILEKPPSGLAQQVPPNIRNLYLQLINSLNPQTWTERSIRDAMKRITKPLSKEREVQKAFFRYIYQAFFGNDDGPRVSAFFAFTSPDIVLERLRYLSSPS
ncbi:MAG: lysine--tRNA ligase [Promethearchaeota archaeon]